MNLLNLLPFCMGDGGDGDATPGPFDTVTNTESQKFLKDKGYTDMEAQVGAHHELQKTIGSMTSLPSDDWGDDKHEAFNAKIRPESVDKYHVTLPESVANDEATKERVKSISKIAFDNGIPKRAFDKTMSSILAMDADTKVAQEKALTDEAAKIKADDETKLKDDWKEDYPKNDELQKRGWKEAAKAGGVTDEAFKEFMEETGFDTHPSMKKIGLAIGKLFADAKIQGGDGGPDEKKSETIVNYDIVE